MLYRPFVAGLGYQRERGCPGFGCPPVDPRRPTFLRISLELGVSFKVQDFRRWRNVMPRGDKSKYTDKQERKADHIAEGYEKRGVPEKEAERRAWATVNKDDGGGKKSGSGRGVHTDHPAAHRGGTLGGEASASRSAEERSASAKNAAATRKRNAEHYGHQ
jgi:plasmid stabilization system protein ParE